MIITIFGSGRVLEGSPGYEQAVFLGSLLAQNGHGICTGGYGGIMEAVAKGAKQGGGHTLGITMRQSKRKANPWIDDERPMPNWRDRLFQLIDTGDAYVVCDGGTGTLTEFFVMWEMANQGLIEKPIVVFGASIRRLTQHLEKDTEILFSGCLKFAATPEQVLEYLSNEGQR